MENWVEISIHTTNEASEIIESILLDYNSTGVCVEDASILNEDLDDNFGTIIGVDKNDFPSEGIIVKGYINQLNFTEEVRGKIEDEIKKLSEHIDIGNFYTFNTNIIKDSDWENSWKEYFDVLNVGNRFVIVPTWRNYENTENKYIINIDPGMAFGTGGHETTSLCIKNLEKYVRETDDVIDVGSGSGILTIAASHLTRGKLKAVDLDKLAVDVSKENFILNNIENRVEVECASLLEKENKSYDIIVANILAHIIELMLADAYKLLKNDGYFITSGIIKDKKDELLEKALMLGFELVEETNENEWYSLVFTK
ncbi:MULTISPECIES: 50S ribosomal protein L11 methyltransferase [unclassified Gemella]|uniref:50S ribosomal protein L11 methyltransferase n=1 Tax=unclassified Gemella TaxID=2624949 RepID=UPI001072FFB5|nr:MULTISPECIES: 50S ribosomal protein L11 methyltransferase [unclassified Gemella]MBF0710190.1 50S ribosomal protein L11 methyltransferase [Gemella sp. GL1.1]MBF0746490.1 50S ribosomal protein L11 methyltransferase [Gemella sp. 19428wG2_WT2a]NYS27534.1 50S ribosomal protein L11 methyltransferase [Gemella sp. GL1]TFU60270.1 50S ribosomal protein L11 methyltransferase [Gemella sp. WT2a]